MPWAIRVERMGLRVKGWGLSELRVGRIEGSGFRVEGGELMVQL